MTMRDWPRRFLPAAVRGSYLAKLTIALLLVVVVVAGVGVNAYLQADAELDASVEADSLTVARLEADRVGDWDDRNVRIVRMLSKYQDLQHDEPRAVELFLQREAWFLPDTVRAVHVVDADTTTVIASTASWRTHDGTDFAAEGAPWAVTPPSFGGGAQVHTSSVYTSLGEPVVAYVTPVPRRPDQWLVLVATIPSFESSAETGVETGTVQLVDGEGTVFYDGFGGAVPHRLGESEAGEPPDFIRGGPDREAGFLGRGEVQPPLRPGYVLGYAPVPDSEWTVLVYTPTADAYQAERSITTLVSSITVVSLVGLLVIAATIGRNTVRTLRGLAEKAERLERGDLDVDLSTGRADEFGELAAAFDSLQQSLRRQIEAAEAARADAVAAAEDLAETNEALAEQREMILVLHRLLRHNLRNDLSAITWNAQNLRDADLDADEAAALDALLETAERLEEQTRKAQQIEDIAGRDGGDVHEVDLAAAVEHAVAAMRDEHPHASITVDVPEHAFVRSLLSIQSVVEYLVDNAIRHNDRAEPTVAVSVTPASDPDGMVELRVSDDGPGIPETEIEPILEGREQPLRHGSGIGLWLVVWTVRKSGGRVSFADREPRGTTVLVEFEPVGREAAGEDDEEPTGLAGGRASAEPALDPDLSGPDGGRSGERRPEQD
ncbi:sensor histidine kinase [Haloarchaeobius amylolyticus]|uniref:sensor histidine kinase n=1 Tax=Haloarchaeobius amylolyticus TaxID=1198296 RepID=UPI0022703E32|nr:sensor histidine kinase [Haloarchaeobius amylolyticus]